MAESIKVPRAEFEAVIKALLTTPPMPANAITEETTQGRREAARTTEARLGLCAERFKSLLYLKSHHPRNVVHN